MELPPVTAPGTSPRSGGHPLFAAGDGGEAASQPSCHLWFSPLQTHLIEGDRNSRKVENSSKNMKYSACSQLHTHSRSPVQRGPKGLPEREKLAGTHWVTKPSARHPLVHPPLRCGGREHPPWQNHRPTALPAHATQAAGVSQSGAATQVSRLSWGNAALRD